MIERIVLKRRGDRSKLAKLFKVTPECVSNALYFKRDSPTCTQIREAAMKSFGASYLKEEKLEETVKVLNSKGEIERIVTFNK